MHIELSARKPLNLDRLVELGERVDVPLVLHGGSGIAAESLSAAIECGVAKVNYGSYLKQRYIIAIQSALNVDCKNPHDLIGVGGAKDIQVAGRIAVRNAVMERLPLLNCIGKA